MITKLRSIWHNAVGPLGFMWRLRGVIRPYRWLLVLIGLLGVAQSAQALITPQLTRRIIDVAFPARDFGLFYLLSAIMVGMNLVSVLFDSLASYYSVYTNNLIGFRVRSRVFRALHRIPVSYVETHQSGMFLERIARDADGTAGMLARLIPQTTMLVLTPIITLAMMANISLTVTCLVLAVVPIYYTINSILALKLRAWQHRVRRKEEQLTSMTVEAIQGVPTARLFGAGNWLKAVYTGLMRDKIKLAFGMWRTQLIWGRTSWFVSYGWGVLLTVGGWFLVFQDRLTLGDAVALGMYIPLLMKPAEQFIGLYQSLISSSVPTQRVTEILDAAQQARAATGRGKAVMRERISLKNISFAYPGCAPCLRDITLSLGRGETAIMVGPTGSGKTTLLRLLAGFYQQCRGKILVDRTPLVHLDPASYQGLVAMVMAENFFFSSSLLENMRIADSRIDEAAIRDAARTLHLDDWLKGLPNGYHTSLGVGGTRLSTGETQKVAILRALLKKPRLLLLDEITSAMDVVSERHILDGLQALKAEDCITVMTTHRLTLTTEPWVDNVIVLNDGRLTEQGPPLELYARGGQYRRLMDTAGLGELLRRRCCEVVRGAPEAVGRTGAEAN